MWVRRGLLVLPLLMIFASCQKNGVSLEEVAPGEVLDTPAEDRVGAPLTLYQRMKRDLAGKVFSFCSAGRGESTETRIGFDRNFVLQDIVIAHTDETCSAPRSYASSVYLSSVVDISLYNDPVDNAPSLPAHQNYQLNLTYEGSDYTRILQIEDSTFTELREVQMVPCPPGDGRCMVSYREATYSLLPDVNANTVPLVLFDYMKSHLVGKSFSYCTNNLFEGTSYKTVISFQPDFSFLDIGSSYSGMDCSGVETPVSNYVSTVTGMSVYTDPVEGAMALPTYQNFQFDLSYEGSGYTRILQVDDVNFSELKEVQRSRCPPGDGRCMISYSEVTYSLD